ncbi:hypothetical protein PAP_06305 [Palaeococcus pacificus DY20341]|uniref:Uncharacterized protein n=1 Tax=Palaeococcus pacificus DY20341 TaxID=1343739 RepID=A0A075LTJ5_9EURY|nr:hypothetical protein [Palaeococcus pacificus]AIF69659.1 hypothetical protein PAP_06305 [Palaeococcus pacificus DY20341]
MKSTKKTSIFLVMFLLVVFVAGCTQTSEDTAEQINKNAGTTETQTPQIWTLFDKEYTFDSRTYIPFELDSTYKLTITLNIPSGKKLEYLGIIPESELEQWKNDDTASEYLYLKKNVESGTYTTTLNKGNYVFVIGTPTPESTILNEDTVVVKHGDYEAIPIYLTNILYAQNVKLKIDIREDLDINIYLMDEKEYNIWKQGGTPKIYFAEKKATSGYYTLRNYLPADTYYLILDNEYSLLTDKTIDYRIEAEIAKPFTGHIKIIAEEQN